jgi:8-oxoguanine deaminase
MDQTQPIWIKDPLAILADGAERGVVVQGGKIVELVPRGQEPSPPVSRCLTPARMWCCRG